MKKFPFITQTQLEKTLAKAEEALNLIGYIPLVSLLSAAVRSLGGMLQIFLSLTFAASSLFAKKSESFWDFKMAISHFFHGLANVIRAKIEAVPGLSLITCLPYDRLLKKRFKYPVENRPDAVVEVEAEILK